MTKPKETAKPVTASTPAPVTHTPEPKKTMNAVAAKVYKLLADDGFRWHYRGKFYTGFTDPTLPEKAALKMLREFVLAEFKQVQG